ncbi:MAG TPA: glycosyltransferase family 1 protein, partial [Coriobacteriia bacterium]|nr:glycosyltransferase family 1 protein [Coriobacteriia bacterium]
MAARLRRVVRIVRTRGLAGLLAAVLARMQARLERRSVRPESSIAMLVRYQDAVAVDWTEPPGWLTNPRTVVAESLSTAWIMHPPGESSGGHQNLFRFIRYLERAGHRATVYLYDARDRPIDAQGVQEMVAASPSYPHVAAEFHVLDRVAPDTDVIVATGWET